jgi:site-specific DNA-methyltransferase (adenine-specific)
MKVTDKIEITNEDNMALMSRYEDNYFNLAIVDPPYGINETGQRNKTGDRPTCKWKNPNSQIYRTFNDKSIPKKKYFDELKRVSKNQIIWGGNYFTEYLKPSKGWIVWNKKADIKEYLSMAELAWSSFDKKCNLYEHLWAGFKKKYQVKRIHPTEKPKELYEWLLLNYAKDNDKILDTHLGSGSIAIASHNLGFNLTACELDKEYYEASLKRIKNHISQQRLF